MDPMKIREDPPSYRDMWFGEGNAEPWQTWLLRIGLPILAVLVVVGGIALIH